MQDKEQKIARPKQIYTGERRLALHPGLGAVGLSPTHGPAATPVPRVGAGVVWDLGNVLIDWDASRAIAAGVGEDEAARFLAADDFDFRAYNHGPDSGPDLGRGRGRGRAQPPALARARPRLPGALPRLPGR